MRRKRILASQNVHYFSIGAYAAEDISRIGVLEERLWNWAYFADVPPSPPKPRLQKNVQILWVGRMLKWKRVDIVLRAIAAIQNERRFGRLDIVGDGPEKLRLVKLAETLGLEKKCTFHEPIRTTGIREMMRQADFCILSSNRYEGWGVVANEAMSEGALLIANEQAGASKVLVTNGLTGFIFRDGDSNELGALLRYLLCETEMCEEIRKMAWSEMQRLWHPRVGAERLIRLCQGLLGFCNIPIYKEGPCSRRSGTNSANSACNL
jgi:glycosyltransferase involved in cell wall biosynthesis